MVLASSDVKRNCSHGLRDNGKVTNTRFSGRNAAPSKSEHEITKDIKNHNLGTLS